MEGRGFLSSKCLYLYQRNLYNAWEGTSELRDSVTVIKIQLQLLRQNWKLTTILKGQVKSMASVQLYLEDLYDMQFFPP